MHTRCTISPLRETQHFGLIIRIIDLEWTQLWFKQMFTHEHFQRTLILHALWSEWRNLRPQTWEDDEISFLDKRWENPWNFCQKAFISFSPFLLSLSWVSPFPVSNEVSISWFAFLFQSSFCPSISSSTLVAISFINYFCLKCLKLVFFPFIRSGTKNFLMFKLDVEKAEDPEIILPTSVGS